MFNVHEHTSIECRADDFLTRSTVADPLIQRIRGCFVTHSATSATTTKYGHSEVSFRNGLTLKSGGGTAVRVERILAPDATSQFRWIAPMMEDGNNEELITVYPINHGERKPAK